MLLTKEVVMKWNPSNKKHYENKGYIFTKFNDNFIVKISDLSKNSHYLVDVQCDSCEKISKIPFREYNKLLKKTIVCSQCNSIYYKNPELIKYFADIEDSKIYSAGSRAKVNLKCPICGYVRSVRIQNLKSQGFSCPKCSDGISYPNKFAFNFLEQLKIEFIPEYSQPWSKGKKYDFYFEINNKSYILEMDGGFHSIDNSLSGQTKEKSHEIDVWKDEVAEKHGIQVIRINCEKSEMKHIKSKIECSLLSKVFDLSIIQWCECDKYTFTNLLKLSCDLWHEYHNIKQIAEKLKLNKSTVIRYLKRGSEYNLCDYDPKKESEKNNSIKRNSKKIICKNTNEIFESIASAVVKYKTHTIHQYLHGKFTYAGKHPITGEKLHWMYYEDYLKLQESSQN